MKILRIMAVAQLPTIVAYAWFNRRAWHRILVLRQQLAVYKRKSKKPMLRKRDFLFWSLISKIWKAWKSESIPVLNGLHHD
jgi:hypothetical protein